MRIRAYRESDRDFLVGLARRFMDFELMGWRDPTVMEEAQVKLARESADSPGAGTEIFVAEEETGELLGFVELQPRVDALSGVEQGYIAAIAVSVQGEGKGTGKRLMLTAEDWARRKGYKQLVLNVFMNNERAVNFYRHLHYEMEVAKMVKEL
jgi:ribosomal protein S18 acetylase RimI-like enzyme